MTLARARILKADAPATRDGAGASPSSGATQPTRVDHALARRMAAGVVDAHAEAARVLGRAHAEAEAVVAGAAAAATSVAEGAAREARDRELARLTAELLVVRAGEERDAERDLDRTIAIAVLLAERLVGEAIALDPARVQALAAHALHETRGARQMRIEACEADVPALRALLGELGQVVATIEPSAELGRGSLVVHTELGHVDARLQPQLQRLADALREALRRPS